MEKMLSNYHIRRADKEISDRKEIQSILKNSKYAIIGMANNNEPYVVTLSCGFDEQNNRLYFHCSSKGQKIEFIVNNHNVCATIIEDKGYILGKCDHNYSSLIIRGKIRIVDQLAEKKHGLDILLHHLEKDINSIKEGNIQNDNSYMKVCILSLDIGDISAKHH
jgi:nitroimidazol reductase NimA-like FMN-containing flavoprotein (pyridoxamine 5'-phosphate oxidase superfamily)